MEIKKIVPQVDSQENDIQPILPMSNPNGSKPLVETFLGPGFRVDIRRNENRKEKKIFFQVTTAATLLASLIGISYLAGRNSAIESARIKQKTIGVLENRIANTKERNRKIVIETEKAKLRIEALEQEKETWNGLEHSLRREAELRRIRNRRLEKQLKNKGNSN